MKIETENKIDKAIDVASKISVIAAFVCIVAVVVKLICK